MQFVFLCDKPFQIFNCFNFVYHNIEDSLKNSDLIVCKNFKDPDKLIEGIRRTHIFQHVYEMDYFAPNRLVRFHQIKKLLMILFPRLTLRKHMNVPLTEYKALRNAVLVSSCPNFQLTLFLSCFKNASVYFIDDGTGSYFGNLLNRFTTKKLHLLGKILKRGPEYVQVQKLYVNNPSLCHSDITKNIYPLPRFNSGDETYKKVLWNAFSYQREELYDRFRFIWLSQPFQYTDIKNGQLEVYQRFQNKILQTISSLILPDIAVMRLHPAEQHKTVIPGFKMDSSNYLWELICADQITDRHVLISYCSTTQIMPKILYNKEPYLIFLCNMLSEFLPKQLIDDWNRLIQFLRSNYSHPEKIFAPSSLEQLQTTIRFLSEHNGVVSNSFVNKSLDA